jgi:hypothetical protein
VGRVDCCEAEPRRQDAIERRRSAATLHVAEHGGARFHPLPPGYLRLQPVTDATEPRMPELVGRGARLGDTPVDGHRALCHDDDRESPAALRPPANMRADLFELEGPLRN